MINQINWRPLLLTFVVFSGTEFSRGHAQDTPAHWCQFRGPNGDGISVAKDLPVEFDEAKHVRWKTSIPDSGWSSPVIWEDEIWLTTGSDEEKDGDGQGRYCSLSGRPNQ